MWVQIALIAAQLAMSKLQSAGLFRKRPGEIAFDEVIKNNSPSEIRPIAYIAGTVEVTPSRIWYGDFTQHAVERDSHWSDYLFLGPFAGLLDTLTVAYKYHCAETFALAYGPDVHIERLTTGERLMFQATPGTDNAGGGFLVDDPHAWGGEQPPGEGGVFTWYDITRGNYIDATNPYLESILTTPPNKTPSCRGVSLLIARGESGYPNSGYFAAGGLGFIPRFRESRMVLRRQPNNLATGFHLMGRHANPMEVFYEHSISNEYGARVPNEELNITSLQSVAQQLYEESEPAFTSGWSGAISSATTPEAVCRNVLAQIDAVAEPSPSLGLTIRLIRRDYVFASLPVLNSDVITGIERFSPGTYDDTVNKIIVPFKDPENNFVDRPGIYIDPANQLIQDGRIVPQTQDYLGVGDYETANMLATRDGRALAIPRAVLECTVQPSFGRLRFVGETVKFQWSNPSFSLAMRVSVITPPAPRETDWRLELVEDQFATGLRVSGEPGGTSHVDPAAGLDVAPPSATWDTTLNPPDGLVVNITVGNAGDLTTWINGAIIFGTYAPGGQFARIWVTEPGGTQTLSPIHLAPDTNNKAQFDWPAMVEGVYEFCVQTFSLRQVTNGVKVCASIEVVFSDTGANAVTINGITVTQNSVIMTGGW